VDSKKMSADTFYSWVVRFLGFAVILYLTDIVITRGFKRLDCYFDRLNADKQRIRNRIDILIILVILVLLLVACFINLAFFYPSIFSPFSKATLTPSSTETTALLATPGVLMPSTEEIIVSEVPSPSPIEVEDTGVISSPVVLTGTIIGETKVIASRTTEQELKDLQSIWIAKSIDLIIKPGDFFQSHKVSVLPSDRFRWSIKWCAVDKESLKDNLDVMSVDFTIDGEKLDKDKIYEFESSNQFWKCHNWSTTLSDWKSGVNISFVIRMNFFWDLTDGMDIYPSGVYEMELKVFVE
jgi:hypothetical protein